MKPKCLSSLDWIKQDGLWGIEYWKDISCDWYILNAQPSDDFVLLGYPTKSSFQQGETFFAAPLYIENHGKKTLIFDEGIHGYNGELDQEPNEPEETTKLTAWACPACESTHNMAFGINLTYQIDAEELEEDGFEAEIIDLFDNFTIYSKCKCGHVTDVTSYECA